MLRKIGIQCFLLIVILLASFASPGVAKAWSGCGAFYTVQWGDSLGTIAGRCGTTVTALYAANPGISGYLYAGQVLAMPGGNSCNCPQTGYSNTYVVQPGDTFAMIANRAGISVGALWAANPQIWNINWIYTGQIVYVPSTFAAQPNVPAPQPDTSWFQVISGPTEPLIPRSYGTVPPGTQTGNVKLINSANAEVYVSLQGTTGSGIETIHEYPVVGTMREKIPSGWYIYVAWVGGKKFSGQFQLHGDSNQTIIFYSGKVVLQ